METAPQNNNDKIRELEDAILFLERLNDLNKTKIKELENSENGWQNQGICRSFAKKNINIKYREVWLCIVDESFAYGKTKTNRHPMTWWVDKIGISLSALKRQFKWLLDNKFIDKIPHKGYIEGGGSLPYSYAPCFPAGTGRLWIINKQKTNNKTEVEKGSEQWKL
jgi:hypothetical protein